MPERKGAFVRSVPLGVGRAGNLCVSGGQARQLTHHAGKKEGVRA